jgi:hypothetical protein
MNIDRMIYNNDTCGMARYFEICQRVILKGSGYDKFRAYSLKIDMFSKWEASKLRSPK